MIRIPLVDLDSGMNLHKIYNLPIFHQNIGKSLKYQPEGTNLAITETINMLPFYLTLNSLNALWLKDTSVI